MSVKITTSLDVLGWSGRITAATRKVLTDSESLVLDTYRNQWVGWKYEGRPKSAPRLVSFRQWRSSVSSKQDTATLTISNKALGWRSKKPYVAFVHRAGTKAPLAALITKDVSLTLVPDIVAKMERAIQQELTKPAPTRVIKAHKATPTETLDLEF